jgi:hypothetical protein
MARDVQREVVRTTPVETGAHEMYIVFTRLRIAVIPGPPGLRRHRILATRKHGCAVLALGYKTERVSGIRGERVVRCPAAFRPAGDEGIWRFREGLP